MGGRFSVCTLALPGGGTVACGGYGAIEGAAIGTAAGAAIGSAGEDLYIYARRQITVKSKSRKEAMDKTHSGGGPYKPKKQKKGGPKPEKHEDGGPHFHDQDHNKPHKPNKHYGYPK